MVHPARLFVKYSSSDQLELRFGRFHRPLGYFTTAFPQGGFTYHLAIGRSRLIELAMGKGVLPGQMLGVSLSGTHWLARGALGIRYNLVVGDADEGTSRSVTIQKQKAFAARLGF